MQTVMDGTVHTIPRSREVGQSYLTSIWTTLVAIFAAFRIVLVSKPDLVRLAHKQTSATAIIRLSRQMQDCY